MLRDTLEKMDVTLPSICFVGLGSLPALVPDLSHHGIGGEELQRVLLARAFAERGYPTSIIVGDYGQMDQTWDGIKTYNAVLLDKDAPVIKHLRPRVAGLWSALKRANADIYYVSCAGKQVGFTVLFAKRYKRQVIFRIASDADCDPNNLLINDWKGKKIYEYGLRRVSQILAQTEHQKTQLKRNYSLDSSLALMMVEPSQRKRSLDKRDIDILWVNNLRDLKRPDLAVDLAATIPELNFHMIGGRSNGYENLYSLIKSRALELENLSFHGRITYPEVNSFYERARVFVNTSDTEGFPNSYLQSWIRGTPVVAFFDPDGLIEREGLGRTVSSLGEMATAVRSYYSDRSSWLETSERCREYMKREYDEEKILAPYIKSFGQLANENSNL